MAVKLVLLMLILIVSEISGQNTTSSTTPSPTTTTTPGPTTWYSTTTTTSTTPATRCKVSYSYRFTTSTWIHTGSLATLTVRIDVSYTVNEVSGEGDDEIDHGQCCSGSLDIEDPNGGGMKFIFTSNLDGMTMEDAAVSDLVKDSIEDEIETDIEDNCDCNCNDDYEFSGTFKKR